MEPAPSGQHGLARRAVVAQNRRVMERISLNQVDEAPAVLCGGMAASAPTCQSERGAWGELCPDCGARLPPLPTPLQSWHAARRNDPILSERARALRSPLRNWHLR